jgi:hypothetical protein
VDLVRRQRALGSSGASWAWFEAIDSQKTTSTDPAKRQMTDETIPVKPTWCGHSAFPVEAEAAKILIDPFLSDNPSWDKGWIGCRAGEDSTQGGGR